ncbi:MAG TPA: hypothetical protein VGA50_04845 [Kiloniellales bacterium]
MSWQASAWAKAKKTGSPSRKAVLLCLAEACDQWGWTWAGELMIAADAELSDRHVRRIVKDLAECGLVTIFQGRGAHGARRNLYRLNFAARAKDPMPDEHPSLSERYQHHAGMEKLSEALERLTGTAAGDPPDRMSGGATGQDVRSPPDKSGEATGHLAPSHRTPVSGEPIRTDSEPETRARASDDPDGSAACAPDDQEADTPVNAHWRAKLPSVLRYFAAEPLFAHMAQDCTPDSDDGAVLTLAVPTAGFGQIMRDRFATGMEKVLERDVRFKATRWAFARREERKAKLKAAS